MREGRCHLCGQHGKLSFEHVPPQAAFNNRPLRSPDFNKVIESCDPDWLRELKGKISQRGAGAYTLCAQCNNNTGHWYGGNYAMWAYQAYAYVYRSPGNLALAYPYHVFPLHIIKQIVCMFFSVNPPAFRDAHEDLLRFVLNPREKYLPPKKRFYVAYSASDRMRQSGINGVLQLDEWHGTTTKVFSEILFPPFTYVFCSDSMPPDDRLVDINFFSRFSYKEFTSLNLRIPILPVYTWIPGDFRSRDEVQEPLRQASFRR